MCVLANGVPTDSLANELNIPLTVYTVSIYHAFSMTKVADTIQLTGARYVYRI